MITTRWMNFAYLVLLARAVALIASSLITPVEVVGDYATDYYPRGEFLASNLSFATSHDIPLDFYLRPPGSSVLVAIGVFFGADAHSAVIVARITNVFAECLALAFLFSGLQLLRIADSWKLILASVLMVQPYTVSYLNSPGPDTVVMFLMSIFTYLLMCQVVRRGGHAKNASLVRILVGGVLAFTVLLRAEMVVLAPLLALLWFITDRSSKKFELASKLPVLIPIIIAMSLNALYSFHVQDRMNMWSGGQDRFTNKDEIVWLRSWYGDESVKTDIGWYWYRGQHLSMDYVPAQAVRDSQSRALVSEVVESARRVTQSDAADFAPLRILAEETRADSPFDWYVGIPVFHAFAMWIDVPIRSQWWSFFHQVNWRVPFILTAFCSTFLVLGCVLMLFRLLTTSSSTERWVFASFLFIILSRTGLFAATISMPESRYIMPVVPVLIMMCLFGWASIISRAQKDLFH